MAPKRIALLICSTRTPRICPSIAAWLTTLLTPLIPENTTLMTLDLASFPLPISPSGSVLPAKLPLPLEPDPYVDAEVNAWSNAVRDVDAFVMLTPQYNWSIPGSLKVAIDHLFHEWKGKPMMVVSYGGKGGGRASVHLKEVWMGIRGGECVGGVELAIEGAGMGKAQQEGVLDETVVGAWLSGEKDIEIVEKWEALVKVVGGGEGV